MNAHRSSIALQSAALAKVAASQVTIIRCCDSNVARTRQLVGNTVVPVLTPFAASPAASLCSLWFLLAGFFIPYAAMPAWWAWYYW